MGEGWRIDGFDAQALILGEVPAGTRFFRLFEEIFPDALGVGVGRSRFDDPRHGGSVSDSELHRTLYLASDPETAFVEVILRDRFDGNHGVACVLSEAMLWRYAFAVIETTDPLLVVDLRGENCLKMRMPREVWSGNDYSISQNYGFAIRRHPAVCDGIAYHSANWNGPDNKGGGRLNLAVFVPAETEREGERGIPPLSARMRVVQRGNLMRLHKLPEILDRFQIGLVP